MCKFISFFHDPETGELKLWDLESHGNTEKQFGLDPKGPYREGHYLPNGEVESRVTEEDTVTQEQCNKVLKAKYPTFTKFFNYAIKVTKQDKEYKGSLDLRDLTSAKGLVLPKSISGWLDLRGLTSAEGLVLPESIGGGLRCVSL